MLPEQNKTVIIRFVEEVINQGQLERADDLVAVYFFLELDSLPGQQPGCEGEGYGGRLGCSRQDGGESNPNAWPEHDQTAWCHFGVTGTFPKCLSYRRLKAS